MDVEKPLQIKATPQNQAEGSLSLTIVPRDTHNRSDQDQARLDMLEKYLGWFNLWQLKLIVYSSWVIPSVLFSSEVNSLTPLSLHSGGLCRQEAGPL